MQISNKRSSWFLKVLSTGIILAFLALTTASSAQEPVKKPAAGYTPKLSEAEQKIEAALAKPVTCQYQNTPLADVVADLAKQVDLPIELDDEALKEAGVDRTTPITFAAGPLSLRGVLTLLHVRHEIGYLPGLGGLRLTAEDIVDEDRNLIVRVYPINDLLKDRTEPTPAYGGYLVSSDYESLIDLMSSHIDADSWTDNGGTGAISGFGGSLVVRQTLARHHRVAEILAGLRKLPLKSGTVVQTDAGPAYTALAKPLSGEAKGDLDDFVQQVSESLKTPVVLDAEVLKDSGVETTVPVHGAFHERSGYDVLKAILRPLALTAVVYPEFVWVTEEGKEPPHDTRLYSVDGLVDADEPEPQDWYGFGALGSVIDLITSTVDPDQWTDNGGQCRISGIDHPACVTVTASPDIHLQIEPLLNSLRESRKDELAQLRSKDDKIVQRVYQLYLPRRQLKAQLEKPAKSKPASDDKPTSQLRQQPPRAFAQFGGMGGYVGPYGFAQITDPIPSADDVAVLIRELLPDPSWKEEGVLLRPFHDVLIVRQRRPMLGKVEKLLTDIDAWHTPLRIGNGPLTQIIPVVGDRR